MILVDRRKERILLGQPRYRYKGNVEIGLKGIEWENVE